MIVKFAIAYLNLAHFLAKIAEAIANFVLVSDEVLGLQLWLINS